MIKIRRSKGMTGPELQQARARGRETLLAKREAAMKRAGETTFEQIGQRIVISMPMLANARKTAKGTVVLAELRPEGRANWSDTGLKSLGGRAMLIPSIIVIEGRKDGE